MQTQTVVTRVGPGAGRLTTEAAFLFRLAGPLGSSSAPAEPPEESVVWDRLLALAEHERALPTLRAYVRRCDPAWPGPAARAQLDRLGMVAEFRLQYLAQRLEETLAIFNDAGIRCMLLKGAALATTVYGSFYRRQMSDVDVLVDASRAEDAWALAAANGWRRIFDAEHDRFYEGHQHLSPLGDSRGIGVGLEIHTSLFGAGAPIGVETDALWRDAMPVKVGRECAWVPSRRDLLLHNCAHFVWSHQLLFGGWRCARDLQAMLDAGWVQWEEFVTHARRTRAETVCYWALRLGHSLSQIAVPADVLTALAPKRPAWVLDALERYFVAMLHPSSDWDEPSVMLTKLVWSAAICPGASGHGDARPWDNSEVHSDFMSFLTETKRGVNDASSSRLARWQQTLRELRLLAP